jgi:hypothetical protein
MDTPFENLSKRVKEIEIDGDKILIKPNVKDVEKFITMKDNMTEEDASKMTNCFVNMMDRAYKMENIDAKREDIEAYIAEHYGAIMFKIMEIFGFASKEQIESLKKKAIEKMGAKAQ